MYIASPLWTHNVSKPITTYACWWPCVCVWMFVPQLRKARVLDRQLPWWRHQMETFSALLALCVGNSSMFSLIFALNKRLSKQSWGWGFVTPSRSLWRHCNDVRHVTNASRSSPPIWFYFAGHIYPWGTNNSIEPWVFGLAANGSGKWKESVILHSDRAASQIARLMGPTWGSPGADRTLVGPKLVPWTLLSGSYQTIIPHNGA